MGLLWSQLWLLFRQEGKSHCTMSICNVKPQWQGLVLLCFWKFNLPSDVTEITGNRSREEWMPLAFPTSYWSALSACNYSQVPKPWFSPCPIILYLPGTVTVRDLPSNYTCTEVTVFILFSLPLIIVSIHRIQQERVGCSVGEQGGKHFQRYLWNSMRATSGIRVLCCFLLFFWDDQKANR